MNERAIEVTGKRSADGHWFTITLPDGGTQTYPWEVILEALDAADAVHADTTLTQDQKMEKFRAIGRRQNEFMIKRPAVS